MGDRYLATVTDLATVRARIGASPDTTALLFDFDGTLAPIVDDPAAARAVEGGVELLDALAERFARVAVVSGRPRDFLVSALGAGVDLSGVYGLESRLGGIDRDHPESERWRPVIAEVAAAADLPDGVVVEPKGLSMTVHFRTVPEAEPAVRAWADQVAVDTELEVRDAKASVELHPPIDADKGSAVRALAEGCRTVVYVGDDVGDLPAFAALDSLRDAGLETWKLAVAGAELPEAVSAAADLVLDAPAELLELFGPLAEG